MRSHTLTLAVGSLACKVWTMGCAAKSVCAVQSIDAVQTVSGGLMLQGLQSPFGASCSNALPYQTCVAASLLTKGAHRQQA